MNIRGFHCIGQRHFAKALDVYGIESQQIIAERGLAFEFFFQPRVLVCQGKTTMFQILLIPFQRLDG